MSDASTEDAFVYNGPCWPDATSTPPGMLTLGTGRDTFEPMPSTLPIAYGTQDGYMFIANARMSGIDPGNSKDILDPRNPRTRIRAYFADSGLPLNRFAEDACPFRTAYKDVGNGEYELIQMIGVVFDTCWRSGNLVGKQFRIEAELFDAAGTVYASDSRVITASAADDPNAPSEPNAPGCPP